MEQDDDNRDDEETESTEDTFDSNVANRLGSRFRDTLVNRRALTHVWLISYSDFMTILMIFFLAMYGYLHFAKAALLKSQKQYLSYTEFTHLMYDLKGNLKNQMEIIEDFQKIVLQLPDSVLFSSGRATLSRKALSTIEELAKSIKLVRGDVVVEGHTDNVPIVGGSFKSNWELSAARAFSVIEALIRYGVSSKRLSALGFGEYRSIVPNDNEQNRRKNRRIGIVLLKAQEK